MSNDPCQQSHFISQLSHTRCHKQIHNKIIRQNQPRPEYKRKYYLCPVKSIKLIKETQPKRKMFKEVDKNLEKAVLDGSYTVLVSSASYWSAIIYILVFVS